MSLALARFGGHDQSVPPRTTPLLERETSLASLEAALADVGRGAGRLVLVSGEAGIGKSALVGAFCGALPADIRVLWGACDPLSTPPPLGPLRDIASQVGGELASLMREGDRPSLFTAFLEELRSSAHPLVVVFEDLHWADEATMDLLRFVGRRVESTRALVLLTYRDDQLPGSHPVTSLVGDLATFRRPERFRLTRLSPEAVDNLVAGHGTDAAEVYAKTHGNPFYVTEVLAGTGEGVPETVRDAVLARALRLGAGARGVLDAVSIVPEPAEVVLVRAITNCDPADIGGCIESGMLEDRGERVAFRHDIARLAIQQSIAPARAKELNRAALTFLTGGAESRTDASRLAYHAEQAGDADATIEYAGRAARQASALGAHREAAGQLERLLRHSDRLDPEAHVAAVRDLAYECMYTDRVENAVSLQWEVVEHSLLRADRLASGAALSRVALFLWNAGRNAEAERALERAMELLDEGGPSPQLAEALALRATLCMLARDLPAAIESCNKAIAMAEETEQPTTLARALNSLGSAELLAGNPEGRRSLERSIEVGRETGSDYLVGIGLINLGTSLGELRDYAPADHYLAQSIEHAREHDLDTLYFYGLAWWARVRFEQGQWDGAGEPASKVLRHEGGSPISRITSLAVLGRLRARRGESGAEAMLEEAWELASRTGDLQRLWPVAAARAEAAWLSGRPDKIAELAHETYELACRLGHAWSIGELGFWLWRGEASIEVPENAAEPYLLHIAGRHRRAAECWDEIGCPYERALALADSPRADDQLEALAEFDRLGAVTDSARLSKTLRARGTRGIPRGPRVATRANVAGLTAREVEVLILLMEGLTDSDIADRLFISPRTVSHHVSSILTKLGVSSRTAAAAEAGRLGIALPG